MMPATKSPPRWIVRIGAIEVSDALIDVTVRQGVDELPSATLCLSSVALSQGVEYQAEVTIEVRTATDDRAQLLFAGRVQSAVPVADSTWKLQLAGGAAGLTEQSSGGLATSGMTDLEVLWAVVRLAGLPSEKIIIEGFDASPIEPFEVIAPLEGIEAQPGFRIERVNFSSLPRVGALATEFAITELPEMFSTAECWAHTVVFAGTVFDAETVGLARIRHAIARTLLTGHYSWSRTPAGSIAPFSRDRVRTRLRLKEVVMVRGIATGRRWLRGTGLAFIRSKVSESHLRRDEGAADDDSTPELQEAVLAWQRILDATDAIQAVTSLWEALEFYAAGVQVEPIVPRARVREIAARASQGLEEPTRIRVREALSRMNEPSLMRRIEVAAQRDRIKLTDEDHKVLKLLREFRNDFIHGRGRGLIESEAIAHGSAIVNRLLVHRLYRLHR